MEKELAFTQALLACLRNVRLGRANVSESAPYDYINKNTNGILGYLFPQKDNFWSQLHRFPARSDTVYACALANGITYFVYKDIGRQCFLFLGPMLTKPFSEKDSQKAFSEYMMSHEAMQDMIRFCARLPVIPEHAAYRMADLIMGHLSNTDIPLKLSQINTLGAPQERFSQNLQLPEKEIIEMRRTEQRYEYSISLTEAVKQGNLSLALDLMRNHTPAADNPARNPNPLRNAQNYCIVLNTQLRHALEGSGIHPSKIDALSNNIGLQIEKLSSLSQIPDFTVQVLSKYCHLVQEYSYPGLRPLTHLAVSHIKDHLNDNLTVKDTAAALSVNANYLSSVFHEDLGITFIDFINRERIQQAAALLKHTSLQIQQIATLVGYNNTSYFAKQFRRVTGTSPQKYRTRE